MGSDMMRTVARAAFRPALAVLAATLLLAGCAGMEPWVKPYERASLADPVMDRGRHGAAGAYMNHVYGARESARGSEGGSGGGCGCN